MSSSFFSSIASLKLNGFIGFTDWKSLRATGYGEIPDSSGIYLILIPENFKLHFLLTSIGGLFKGRIPTVAINELEANWIADTIVLYIGKATNLRNRIRLYSQFGEGKPAAHSGGRLIWQIANSEKLLVCWKTSGDDDPRLIEKKLIKEFKLKHNGNRPFANLVD